MSTPSGPEHGRPDPGLSAIMSERRQLIARFLVDRASTASSVTFLECTVNGQPGLVAQQTGVTVAVYAFEVAGDRIRHIWVVLNPRQAPALEAGLTRCPITG